MKGTEKEKILRDLADPLFPDLFVVNKTGGSPQAGEFAETPAAKRFFEAMERYKNVFSPEEAKFFCGTLGYPTIITAKLIGVPVELMDAAVSGFTTCDGICP